jgi:hypothetical protein
LTAGDGVYSAVGVCILSGVRESVGRLGFVLFGKSNSNHNYVAETDLYQNIVTFREFTPRGFIVISVSGVSSYAVGEACPVGLVGVGQSVVLMERASVMEKLDQLVAAAETALLKCQLVKIAGGNLSVALPYFNELASELGLSGQEAREFVTAQVDELQHRKAIWESLGEPQVPVGEQFDDYTKWSDDRIVAWLASRTETDEGRWYKIWKYYDESRPSDVEFIISGLDYLNEWSQDSSNQNAVGKVVQRLLRSDLVRVPKGRESLFRAISAGFVSCRFFNKSSDTPWFRRIEFFNLLLEELKETGAWGSFMRDFSNSLARVILFYSSEAGLDASLYEEEIDLYIREMLMWRELEGRYYYGEKFDIAVIYYYYLRNRGSRGIKRLMAINMKQIGLSAARITRLFGRDDVADDIVDEDDLLLNDSFRSRPRITP